jgi:TDG/mug DNA glycosylase family protein
VKRQRPGLKREELRTARDKTIPDIIRPGLKVLLCGINPGLYSAATGHHFARPGNRFWKTLYRAGMTSRLLSPDEDARLPDYGCGICNMVDRATAAAADLTCGELRAARRRLVRKIRRYRPRIVAFLGIQAYRTVFRRPHAVPGPQPDTIGATRLWVLPNPSGLNAHYRADDLARLFREARDAAGTPLREKRAKI